MREIDGAVTMRLSDCFGLVDDGWFWQTFNTITYAHIS
jgi:hypothetical protein